MKSPPGAHEGSPSPELGIGEDTSPSPRSNDSPALSITVPSAAITSDTGDVEGQPVSRTSSTLSELATKIPRDQRRGLFARFALIAEVDYPTFYSRRTKWMITTIVAASAAAAPMGSAIILPSLTHIAGDFESTATVTNLAVALYMLSMSIFPLWWSSFSETLGRRTIYVVSFTLFTIFAILSAVAKNIAMLIVMRLLSGGAAASVQAVGAGTIADIWESKERGRAMSLFYIGPLCGPLFAPIIGGILSEGYGWRSTQWFLVAYGGFVGLALTFLLPETLRRREDVSAQAADEGNATLETEIALTGTTGGEKELARVDEEKGAGTGLARTTTRSSVKVRSKRWLKICKRAFIDPLEIVLLLQYPAVALTAFYAAVTFGSLYFLNVSIEDTFSRAPYNFSVLIVGLLYIPNSIGYLLTALFGGQWLDYIMKREARKAGRVDGHGNLILRPEDRMKENAWLAAFMFPAALIWYGWTAEKGVYWIVPMIANFFFGIGSMLIFAMATTMLTEFMPRRASNGIAVNNFLRNIFSCVGALSAAPAIHAIGNGWLFTILGIVSCVSGTGVIWSMKRFGSRWREIMDRKLPKD